MPTIQGEYRDKSLSLGLDIQKMPDPTVEAGKAAPPYESTLVAEAKVPQFCYRILVVDDEPSIRETAKAILGSEGYEVLAVADGFDALHALSKSLPDVIISDLNMPRMSGFELLAIVRKRFPHIATIAMSGEYIADANPRGILADAFLQIRSKGFSRKYRSCWQHLPSGRRERKVTLLPSSCREMMRDI
jgi:CheY-like chemotaxis protein